jgi:hypothetical protein
MAHTPKIIIAGLEVIASGSVIASRNQDVEIHPFASSDYFIRLKFIDAPGQPVAFNVVAAPNDIGVEIILTNFEAQVGDISATHPAYIANHNGFKVYLWLAGHTIGPPITATRVTYFTFYKGEAL